MRRLFFVLAFLGAAVAAQTAAASQVISTSTATNIKLGVNDKGQAFVTYTQGGKTVQVLAFGAVNAVPPTPGGKQVAFTLDYSGGYTQFKGSLSQATAKLRADQALFKKAQSAANAQGKKYTPDVTKYSAAVNADYAAIQKIHGTASNVASGFSCPKYTGPQLAWMVVACTAPDGSYWAIQSWQRLLPDYGLTPSPAQAA